MADVFFLFFLIFGLFPRQNKSLECFNLDINVPSFAMWKLAKSSSIAHLGSLNLVLIDGKFQFKAIIQEAVAQKNENICIHCFVVPVAP